MRRQFAVLMLAAVIGLVPGVQAGEDFWAQVTFVKGTVTVLATQKAPPAPVTRGDVLKSGAVVTAAEGSRATLLLSDGSILSVPAGRSVTLSPKTKDGAPGLKAVAQNLSKTLLSRGGDNPMNKNLGATRGTKIELVIVPTKSVTLMKDSVQFIWLPKYGVKSYQLVIQGGKEDLRQEYALDSTSLNVPAGVLEAGATYYWELHDAADRNTMNVLGSGVFHTLPDAEEKDVQRMAAAIEQTAMDAEEDSSGLFLQYQLYRQHNLNLDALRTLQKMIAMDPADPALQNWRKDLCAQMKVQEEHVPLIAAP